MVNSTAFWSRVKKVYHAALDVDPAHRDSLLGRECGEDETLRREVASLLAASVDDAFMSPPESLPDSPWLVDSDLTGQMIGPYRIEKRLGGGGMGEVFLSSRADGAFEQRVAIKLIRVGWLDARLRRRFQLERQVLARLSHPHIARMLDGGETADRRPYLIMEYIEGEPIDAYCDHHGLPLRQRLNLFLQVCEGMQFAHRNLVLHCDLKPSNVLVTADGAVKILDFGIAQLLQDPDAPAGMTMTGGAQAFLTPAYASPEQIRGESITTASDVYSLGVVLYELLTGSRPYRLKSRALHEIERAVCEDEPQRPSTAVLQTRDSATDRPEAAVPDGENVHSVAEKQPSLHQPPDERVAGGNDPQRWRRRLRGDLDAIVLTALRKQPHQRYASVEQMANDIRNHLKGLPIIARRITPVGRAWKHVLRHRFAVTAVSLIFLSLVGGIVGIAGARAREMVAAVRARQEAENARVEVVKSQQVIRFLKNVLAAGSPHNLGREVSMREVLDLSAQRVEEEFGDDPEVETAIRTAIGETYVALGEFDLAEPHFREALALQEAIHQGDHPDVARSLRNLGMLLYQKHAYEEAEANARAALEMSRRLHGDVHEDVAQDLNNLAAVRRARGNLEDAERLFRQSLEQRRNLPGDNTLEIAETLNNLANLLRQGGDLPGAEAMCREALELRRSRLANDHPLVTQSLFNLAVLLASQQRFDEAIAALEESIGLARKRLGPDHPDLVHALNTLGSIHFMQGDFAAAEEPLRECVRIREASFPAGDRATRYSKTILGRCLTQLGEFEEAERTLLEVFTATAAAEDGNTPADADMSFRAASALHTLYEKWDRPEEAARYGAIAEGLKQAQAEK